MNAPLSPIRPIHTEADYEAALAEYETYFDQEPEVGSEAGDRFELLTLVIGKYEDDHYPMPPPKPVDALRFRMEQGGHTQADLAHLLGSRSRASEILAGKRDLTLDQIRTLHKAWGIPIASLVGELEDA